jgi:hypothetical protein
MTKIRCSRQLIAAVSLLLLSATSVQAANVVLPRTTLARRAVPTRNSWVYLMPTGTAFSMEQTSTTLAPVTFKSNSINPLGLRAGTVWKGWAVEAAVYLYKFNLISTYLGTQSEKSYSGNNLSLEVFKQIANSSWPFRFSTQARVGIASRKLFFAEPGFNPQITSASLTGLSVGLLMSSNINNRVRASLGLKVIPTLKVGTESRNDLKGKIDFAADIGAIYLLTAAWTVGLQGSLNMAGAKGIIRDASLMSTDAVVSFKMMSLAAQVGYQF